MPCSCNLFFEYKTFIRRNVSIRGIYFPFQCLDYPSVSHDRTKLLPLEENKPFDCEEAQFKYFEPPQCSRSGCFIRSAKIDAIHNDLLKIMIISIVSIVVVLVACIVIRLRKTRYRHVATEESSSPLDCNDGYDRFDDIALQLTLPRLPPQVLERTKLLRDTPIGRGNFSHVYKGSLSLDRNYVQFDIEPGKHKVAVKKAAQQDLLCISSMCAEAEHLEHVRELHHPNIVQFLGAVMSESGKEFYLCTEFCSGGSLKGFLDRWRKSTYSKLLQMCNLKSYNIPDVLKLRWAKEICDAMRCLAARNIRHCDLS